MALDATELTWRSRVDLEVTLRTRREDIRRIIQTRFGQVSAEMDALISGTDTEDGLDALFERALTVQAVSDLQQHSR